LLNILKSRHHYENIEEYSNDITDDCGEAEMKLLKEKRLEDIQTAIKQLAPQQRRVVEMKLYNETGNQEIAQALNISVNTVKSLYTSALHNLRKMIQ
jgi:RNA polymerase sigma factor, sigma-70 family